MEQDQCLLGGNELRPSDKKASRPICGPCNAQKRVNRLLSNDYLRQAFVTIWARGFFLRFSSFLQQQETQIEPQARILGKTLTLFQEAEKTFHRPEEMSEVWLETMITQAGHGLSPTFFRRFLIQEQLISPPNRDEKRINLLQEKILSVPKGYQRLVEVYFNERLALRERQIEHKASNPLSVSTIEEDFQKVPCLLRWLAEHAPDVTGWEMVQEEHIYAFLLTLAPISREMTRRKLYHFFRLGRKRRLIAHIPLLDTPSRELPRTVEPLREDEQKALARRIHQNIATHPEEAFLSALCFYHGLSVAQIRAIKLASIDLERGIISLNENHRVFLLEEDLLLLEHFLRKRQEIRYAKQRSHLIISNQPIAEDKPVPQGYVQNKVVPFAGATAQCLRITCMEALSARYGPQYLVEAFGLSISQAGRYGKMKNTSLRRKSNNNKTN